ncbi:MAG TPA: alpha/beta fold hydrolase [Telmatospirillum sp.]|nr:alpha/beta fold hydrolase [Telmatospirillum sp.]
MWGIAIDVMVVFVVLAVGLWLAGRLAPQAVARMLIDLQRRSAGLVEKRVRIPGFEIAYWDGGSGEPLVLVHGLGANKSTFLGVAKILAKRYRTIILDLPGFGDSDKPIDADYGIDADVSYLDQFLVALNVPKAHFGGNSLGGWVVAAYAARFPEKVGSLWLLAAAGTEDLRASTATKAYLERHEYLLLVKAPDEIRRVLSLILHRVPPIPYCVLRSMGLRAAADYDLHRRIFDDLVDRAVTFQIEPRLPAVSAPALLVWGDHDRVVPPSAQDTYHALLPKSEAILLPNIGHVPQMEAPRRVAEDYLKFRDKLIAG